MKLKRVKKEDLLKEVEVISYKDMILDLLGKDIIPLLGGGLHYTMYNKALWAGMDNDPLMREVRNGSVNISYLHTGLFSIFLDIVIGDMVVILSANSSLVEVDYQKAKRILRFNDENYKQVLMINIDWYGSITFDMVGIDAI